MTVINGTNLGKPAGAVSARLIGATPLNNFIYTFVLVKNAANAVSLWCEWWFNAWQPWLNLQTVPGAPAVGISLENTYQGNAIAYNNFLYVFACGNDGKLYCLFYNGAAWAWVCIGAPAGRTIAGVDHALTLPNPLGVFVKANDGSYWFAGWTGAGWIFTAATAGQTFFGSTTAEIGFPFQTRVARFQIDANANLSYSMAQYNAISTQGPVKMNLYGLKRSDAVLTPNIKFAVRGINPNGMQVETPYFSQYANINGDDEYDYGIDLRTQPQFQAGANCWIACDPCADGFAKKNESASNFTYDPNSASACAYYGISAPETGGPFCTYWPVSNSVVTWAYMYAHQ